MSKYADKRTAPVTCATCKKETTEYRPAVINNRPVWVCVGC